MPVRRHQRVVKDPGKIRHEGNDISIYPDRATQILVGNVPESLHM